MASRLVTAPPRSIRVKSRTSSRSEETLGHAITRMRAQGYSDSQIHGQVKQWHPDWSDNEISGYVGVHTQQHPVFAGRVGAIQVRREDPYTTWAKTHQAQHGTFKTLTQIKTDIRRGRVEQDRAQAALAAISHAHHGGGLGGFVKGV